MAWRGALRELGGGLSELWEMAKKTTVFACGVYCFHNNVGQFTMCMGPSMLPTFNSSGDLVICEKLSIRYGEGAVPGDVVVSKSPTNVRHTVCKRVIGLEGQTLLVPSANLRGPPQTVKVPKGHVFLMGDNLENSTDSRQYGCVPVAMLTGRVVAKVWPPHQLGAVERWDVSDYHVADV